MFLALAVPYGLTLGLVDAVGMSLVAGIGKGLTHGSWIALLSGAGFGAIMTAIMAPWHLRSSRTRGSPDPTRVHHTIDFGLPAPPHEALQRARDAVRALPHYSNVEPCGDPNVIRARTRTTWHSFGEKIEIRAVPAGDNATQLVVSSRPRVRTTMADYGRNWENVKTLRSLLVGADAA